jgi:phosphonate degradation associated HDIG domain protein
MSLTLDEVVTLFERRGRQQYGAEAVSQLEHALRCATLAQTAGEGPHMISACLLHDLGHLLREHQDDPFEQGEDDAHEYLALPFLRSLFDQAVLEPIRLHVEAKRYLCVTEPDYWDGLSPASRRSLEVQGGAFSPEEAQEFMRRPYAEQALRLRRWDDQAKIAGQATPDLAHFVNVLRAGCK